MKILVTGANGYLGRGVVDELLKRGNEVIATDFACDHVNSAAHCVPGDIFSIEDPYTYFGEPDVVLHLAWRDGFVHNSNAHFEDLPKHVAFLKNCANPESSKWHAWDRCMKSDSMKVASTLTPHAGR